MLPPAPPRPVHPVPRPLSGLLTAVGGLTLVGSADGVHITGATHDSLHVRPGDLYAALPGSRRHGAEFIPDVTSAAAAVLTDAAGRERAGDNTLPLVVAEDARMALGPVARWVYGDPSATLRVVGITGTNGKTTTAYFVEAGLRAAGRRTGLVGTVETRIDDEAMASVRTTPEATDLQALLAVMLERGVDSVAMEVSSHALALHRVDGTSFAVAVFTNLSQDHLDFHHDLEEYFRAKARLFTPEFARVGVIDIDSAYGERLARDAEIPLVTVSPNGDARAAWQVDDIDMRPDGSSFRLHGPEGAQVLARAPLPGAFNVADAALAVVALTQLGVEPARAAEGVAACTGVPGRMERVDAGQPFLALVDYAHSPDAVERLLAAVRPLTDGRVIAVLGCGGDRDRAKRPLMGAAVAAGADVAVLTSDNPRSEDPRTILAEMETGASAVPAGHRAVVVVEPDRRAAIQHAVDAAAPGDVVVIAGKGHERTQEIGDQVLPFDDAQELRAALAATIGAR